MFSVWISKYWVEWLTFNTKTHVVKKKKRSKSKMCTFLSSFRGKSILKGLFFGGVRIFTACFGVESQPFELKVFLGWNPPPSKHAELHLKKIVNQSDVCVKSAYYLWDRGSICVCMNAGVCMHTTWSPSLLHLIRACCIHIYIYIRIYIREYTHQDCQEKGPQLAEST